MKRYILLIVFITGFVVTGYSQTNQQVSFIAGLGENTSIWDTMAGQLAGEFYFTRDDVPYNSANAVSNSAASVYIPSGTVAVAHSLGGLVAREYLRQHTPNQMKALITVGTPNLGAPVAQSVQNGKVADIISGWIIDLAAGPATSLGSLAGRNYAQLIIGNLGFVEDASGQKINAKLQQRYGNKPSVEDLKPGSFFLNTLNASPNSTLPSARFAIFGAEDGPEYLRIAESANNGPEHPMESGVLVNYHNAASVFYFVATAYYSSLSGYYFLQYALSDSSDPLYFSYYDRAVFFAQVAQQWARGFASLVYYQQRDWDQQVIGVNYYSGNICGNADVCKDANDGLLPAITQAPSFFGSPGNQILRADGANHLEETVHPSVRERLGEVFRDPTVNIEEDQGSGDGGGEIDPPPFPGLCLQDGGPNPIHVICPQEN